MKKKSNGKGSVGLISARAEKAMKEAVAEVIRDHARTGDPVVIWRNGKVVWVPASKLIKRKSRIR